MLSRNRCEEIAEKYAALEQTAQQDWQASQETAADNALQPGEKAIMENILRQLLAKCGSRERAYKRLVRRMELTPATLDWAHGRMIVEKLTGAEEAITFDNFDVACRAVQGWLVIRKREYQSCRAELAAMRVLLNPWAWWPGEGLWSYYRRQIQCWLRGFWELR